MPHVTLTSALYKSSACCVTIHIIKVLLDYPLSLINILLQVKFRNCHHHIDSDDAKMSNNFTSPNGYVGFGSLSNCTLSVCDIKYSVFEYRPSLAANAVFLTLFTLSGVFHLIQGFHNRRSRVYSTQWFYCWAMVLGCVTEVIGYIGRILLHSNPFNFQYFLIQIGM